MIELEVKPNRDAKQNITDPKPTGWQWNAKE